MIWNSRFEYEVCKVELTDAELKHLNKYSWLQGMGIFGLYGISYHLGD